MWNWTKTYTRTGALRWDEVDPFEGGVLEEDRGQSGWWLLESDSGAGSPSAEAGSWAGDSVSDGRESIAITVGSGAIFMGARKSGTFSDGVASIGSVPNGIVEPIRNNI